MIAPSLVTAGLESDLVFNLQDAYHFSENAPQNPRMFLYITLATFAAIQSGMIMARGDAWLSTKHSDLPTGKKPNAKPFHKLYQELQTETNWDGIDPHSMRWCSTWDQGVEYVKNARDDITHPKYHKTHYSVLFLNSGCIKALDYLGFLSEKSHGIRRRFAERLPELIRLREMVVDRLAAMQIDQSTTLRLLDIPTLPAAMEAEYVDFLHKQSAETGAIPVMFKNGLPYGCVF